MIRILTVSDTHGSCYTLGRVLDRHPDAHSLLHLGDGAADMEELLPTCRIPVYQVAGNCDFCAHHPAEQEIRIGGAVLFFTHGHGYSVKSGIGRLEVEARRRGANVALFGHTHEPLCRYENGLYLINPGSLRFGGSYAIIDITDRGILPNIVQIY